MRGFVIAALGIGLTLPLFASQPNPTKRQRELITRLLEVTKASEGAKAMVDAMFGEMEKKYLAEAEARGNDSDAIGETKELFANFGEEVSKIDFSGLMTEEFIRIYAKYFSVRELEQLNAFYDSPTGRKSIEVLPELMKEAMSVGVERLAPRFEEAMHAAQEKVDKKRPWRQTMNDIRTLATAVEGYASDHQKYPAGDFASLSKLLVPEYIRELPSKDMWGNNYAYISSPEGYHYRIVSSGGDSNFEWDSRRVAVKKNPGVHAEVRYSENPGDDIIYADGEFIQIPVEAKRKTEP